MAAESPGKPGRKRRAEGLADVELRVRITAEELATYRDRADRDGLTLSDWVRGRLG